MFTTERIGKTLWLWIALLCLTLLTACGGGGGSGGTPAGGSPISTTPLMTVGIINASGQSVTTITNTSAYSARAILTDAQGNPLANYVVTFSLPSSSVAAFGSTTTALTNSAGVAAVPVYAASVLANGATTMTASAGVGTATVTATGNFAVQTTGANLTVSIVNASGFSVNNIFYTGSFYAQAVLVDSFGRPLANTVVSFSMGATSAANFGLGTTALTNSAGVASVPIYASSVAVFGASTLTATATLGVATVSNTMNFSVTSSGAALRVSILNAATGAPVTNINYTGSYTVQAVLVDGSGNPLPGNIVSFSLTDATVATLGGVTSALTNSSGVATVSLSAASVTSIGASAVMATATVGGTTVTGVGNFSVSASGAPAMSAQILNAGGAVTSNITYTGSYNASVTLVNGAGAPVANTVVTFSLASSGSTIAQLGGTGTALTNNAGVATIPVSAVSVLSSGATTLTASATVGGLPVTASVNFSVSSSGASLTASIVNATTNAATSNITYAGSYLAQARLVDGSGNPLANCVVTFSLGASTIATLGSDTTGLTNSSGIASVPIAAASLLSQGAGTLTATASVGVVNLSSVANFAVAPSSVSLGPISAGSTTLASGTTTSLSVLATISGSSGSSNNIVNVTFQASCGQINNAGSSSSVVSNGSGLAQAIYSSVSSAGTLCSGPVTITASTPGATAVSLTLNVASPTASAVLFVPPASAPQIYVIGSGSITQSVLTYKVTTSAGTAMAGATVTFGITVNPGGVTLGTNASTVPISSTTDSNGLVTVAVNSGTVPGPVNVMAALTSSCGGTAPVTMSGMSACTVYALSQNLTVASGPPSQRYMSLSISTFNVEAWDIDGTQTTVTVRVADRQGNPVVDGTVVNFTTDSGQIASNCATKLSAQGISGCSVTWSSQAPRPAQYKGRAAVLAFTNGQKDYIDVNGNNKYDAGTDQLIEIGNPYRDDNESGNYVQGDFVIQGLACDAASGTSVTGFPYITDPQHRFTSSGEPYPFSSNTCTGDLPTTVRAQGIILESSSTPALGDSTVVNNSTAYRLNGTMLSPPYTASRFGPIQFYLTSAANHNLPMPATTQVVAKAVGTPADGCTAGTVQGTPVVNVDPTTVPSANLGTLVSIPLTSCTLGGDQIAVTVTAPSGVGSTFIFTLQ